MFCTGQPKKKCGLKPFWTPREQSFTLALEMDKWATNLEICNCIKGIEIPSPVVKWEQVFDSPNDLEIQSLLNLETFPTYTPILHRCYIFNNDRS